MPTPVTTKAQSQDAAAVAERLDAIYDMLRAMLDELKEIKQQPKR